MNEHIVFFPHLPPLPSVLIHWRVPPSSQPRSRGLRCAPPPPLLTAPPPDHPTPGTPSFLSLLLQLPDPLFSATTILSLSSLYQPSKHCAPPGPPGCPPSSPGTSTRLPATQVRTQASGCSDKTGFMGICPYCPRPQMVCLKRCQRLPLPLPHISPQICPPPGSVHRSATSPQFQVHPGPRHPATLRDC